MKIFEKKELGKDRINKKHKIIKNVLAIFTIISLSISSFYNISFGYEYSEQKEGIDQFPESYRASLNELKAKHPNWNFVAVDTNLSWDYVVNQEMVEGRSLISTSFSDIWKRDATEIEPGYVNASKYAVEYYLDPRNFLTEEKIFQFELSDFKSTSHTTDVIEAVLAGTGLSNKDYYINANNVIKIGKKYSDLIYDSGVANNVSPVHLASRIIQETGGTLASLDSNGNVILNESGNLLYQYSLNGELISKVANRSINGSYSSETYGDYSGYYNFFNIGAHCSSACGYCGNPFLHGLQKAKDSGWDSPEKAINAAGAFLRSEYINYGQNTIYFEKFDVNFIPGAKYLFGGQYMTNISAASSESLLMYKGYNSTNKLNDSFTFYIPVYDLPSTISDTVEKKVQVINCEGSVLNLRSGPDTSFTKVCTLPNGTIMTQVLDDGSGWVKVRLDDGTIGYVSKDYITYNVSGNVDLIDIKLSNTNYSLNVGSILTIEPIFNPSNATDRNYRIESSNSNVVLVENKSIKGISEGSAVITYITNSGKTITANVQVNKAPENVSSYSVDNSKISIGEGNTINNINVSTNVSYIKSSISLNGGAKISATNIKGEALNDDNILGTGTIVKILDSNNNEIGSYNVIIKGDVSGDGKISASDYVLVKNSIMGSTSLVNAQNLGADVNKDEKVSAADYVRIKNHIMGISMISN